MGERYGNTPNYWGQVFQSHTFLTGVENSANGHEITFHSLAVYWADLGLAVWWRRNNGLGYVLMNLVWRNFSGPRGALNSTQLDTFEWQLWAKPSHSVPDLTNALLIKWAQIPTVAFQNPSQSSQSCSRTLADCAECRYNTFEEAYKWTDKQEAHFHIIYKHIWD